jgi:bacillithiol system protein YtxJ
MQKHLLESSSQLSEIINNEGFSLIFKHSTRCSISSMALNRIEKSDKLKNTSLDYYYLDLIKHRDLSNKIASDFSVPHESPQIILMQKGEVILDASHSEINAEEILETIAAQSNGK